MKIVTDLSVSGVRGSALLTYLPPGGSPVPELIADFASGIHAMKDSWQPFAEIVTFTRASTATFWDASGILQTAALDAPRFDHDPATGQALGLLVEDSATNLIVQSNAIAIGGWAESTTSGPSASLRYLQADAAPAPDGTMTATRVVESTAVDVQRIFKPLSVTDGAPYTFSVFLKGDERSEVQLRTTGRIGPVFDLAAGTMSVAGSAMDDQGIVPVGDDWYRCWFTTTASGAQDVPWIALMNGGTTSYVGDGASGLYAWGVQYEAGWGPTSLIVTGASSATRAAESATHAGDVAALGLADGFTILGLGRAPRTRNPDGSAVLLGLGVAGNDRATLGVRDFGLDGSYDPFFQGVVGSQSGVFNTPVSLTETLTLALGVDASGSSGAVGGQVVWTGGPGTVTPVSRVDMGAFVGGSRKWGGTIERLVIYPSRLTDAQLQEITA